VQVDYDLAGRGPFGVLVGGGGVGGRECALQSGVQPSGVDQPCKVREVL
jgi:hypothetical protein